MSGTSGAKDEWVTRVLGVRFAIQPAALSFEAVRPTDKPGAPMTDNLLAALARTAPVAPEELPTVLEGMIPRFLLAMAGEPHMEAAPLGEGASLPGPDQVLTVADSLNAALRSARRWEALLDQAKEADKEVDGFEALDRDAAQQEHYERAVVGYNVTRLSSLEEQARCMDHVRTLATEFRAAQTAASR